MKKQQAINLLGGTITQAAKEIGISYQAVRKWPDPLPSRISDRVYAALARQQKPVTKQSAFTDAARGA